MNAEVSQRVTKHVPKQRRKKKVVELIDVDGKKVSKTSTGKRKFHNKSKSGCDNCKRRRVKCDEGKPMCLKCSNMKLDCVYSIILNNDEEFSNSNDIATENDSTSNMKKESSELDKIENNSSNNSISDFNMKQEDTNMILNRRRGSIVIPMNSPEKQNGTMDALLLPSLSNTANLTNPHFLHQQLFLLPQLMSLSNSEKFTNFDLNLTGNTNSQAASATAAALLSTSNHNSTSNSAKSNTENSNNNDNNATNNSTNNTRANTNANGNHDNAIKFMNVDSPMQSVPLIPTNSLSSLLSMGKFSSLTSDLVNAGALGQPLMLNNISAPNSNNTNTNNNNANNNISNISTPANPLSLYSDSLALLNKAGLNLNNLKGLGNMLGSPNLANLAQFDFQDLNSLKQSSQAMKVSIAEEVLTNMQKQMTKSLSQRMHNNHAKANSKIDNSNNDSVSTPDLANNPTISPSVPITPVTRSIIENGSTNDPSMNILNNRRGQGNSPSAAVVGGRDPDPSMNTNENTNLLKAVSMNPRDIDGVIKHSTMSNNKASINNLMKMSQQVSLNLVDLKLFYHYCTKVWPTIIAAGISGVDLWSEFIPELSFEYPFLMHSLLAFSATHLSRQENGLEHYVSSHRIEALRLLREAVLEISPENTDALVASALILIMDSLANASGGVINSDGKDDDDGTSQNSSSNTMSPSAWIFHVKGASTILTAVWPLNEESRFHNLISIDLSDFGNIINQESDTISELICFDENITDLYPVEIDSPYLITLAYLDKLNRERNQPNFILKIFAFPALLDKTFLALLMTGDLGAMRIMRSYYKILRGYTTDIMDEVWFLEGVSQVLPQDVDEYSGGGGMHMMLDFLGGGLPSMTTTNLSEFM